MERVDAETLRRHTIDNQLVYSRKNIEGSGSQGRACDVHDLVGSDAKFLNGDGVRF